MYVDAVDVPGLELLLVRIIPLSRADHALFPLPEAFALLVEDVVLDLGCFGFLLRRYLLLRLLLGSSSFAASPSAVVALLLFVDFALVVLAFVDLVAFLVLPLAVVEAVVFLLKVLLPWSSPSRFPTVKPLIPAPLPPPTSFRPFMQVNDDLGRVVTLLLSEIRCLLLPIIASSDTLLIDPADFRGTDLIQAGFTPLLERAGD